VLKWAREHDCPWDFRTCAWAAGDGHLDVWKWAREHGCPWDEMTTECAAAGGHLEVLRWARERGCEWDKRTIDVRAVQVDPRLAPCFVRAVVSALEAQM
jgi:hypothetical protein